MKTKRTILNALSLAAVIPFALSANEDETIHKLDPYAVVSTMRTEKSLATIPQTISLIGNEDWSTQLSLSLDPISALSQLVPSFSPSRQKMSGFGETFRGRSPLFMIDGVPQSNPLRDGSRDGYTIDSPMIERIEIIHGASAAQGMGATGGIINFITVSPPAEDGFAHKLEVGTEFSDELEEEGTGYYTSFSSRYRSGKFGYATVASYKWRPMAFDGDGNLVGIDNTQGDTMNSATTDLFGKFTYDLTDKQTIQLMANRFRLEQDLEYISVSGNAAAGIPTTSIKGTTPGEPTRNAVDSVDLAYTHRDFIGGSLKVNAFHQDFAATYGGGTFDVFQLTSGGAPVFDQSQNESTKRGLKLTFLRDMAGLWDLGVVTGLDYLEDETRQALIQTGRVWVPESTYSSIAPYMQLEKPFGKLVVSGGVRFEDAQLEVNDFTTLQYYGSQFVEGGKPSFSEWLFNLGLTYEAVPGVTTFLSYSQGFGMPDVGRVLRGINVPGQKVASFLDLQPIVTDNFELGIRKSGSQLSASASIFYSKSDLGSRLIADVDGIFSVSREKTETYGIELSTTYQATERDRFDLRFAVVEGRSDQDGDGKVDTRLDGTNIPPIRLNLGWNAAWTERFSTRLQSSSYFDRDDPTDNAAKDFNGYTLIDLLANIRLPKGQLQIGIANLLDKQYITYYSQTTPANDSYFAGRGRTINVRYSLDF